MQTMAVQEATPDLVATAWKTEGRIKALELSTSPTMIDLRDTRIKVDQIALELHETKVYVQTIANVQNTMLLEIRRHGLELQNVLQEQHRLRADMSTMQSDMTAMQSDMSTMKAEQRRQSVILHALVDHFGVDIPTTEPEPAARGQA